MSTEAHPARIGRYEIQKPLGSGAMGDVFLAHDPNIDRLVAIKTVRVIGGNDEDIADRRGRLLREARAAGKFQHPNVVALYDAGEANGLLYLAFEYVPGQDLLKRARQTPEMSLREVLRVVRETASALDYAQAQNVVHRDIKPSNILLGPKGVAKVADFGIAKLRDQSVELTRTGSVVGSPQYMSPEQIRGEDLDGRSDIFSLGVVLYELLSRTRPFGGDTISTLVFEILAKEPAPIESMRPGLPAPLVQLVRSMMVKDRNHRIADAGQVVEAIQALERQIAAAELDGPASQAQDSLPTQLMGSGAGPLAGSGGAVAAPYPSGPQPPLPFASSNPSAPLGGVPMGAPLPSGPLAAMPGAAPTGGAPAPSYGYAPPTGQPPAAASWNVPPAPVPTPPPMTPQMAPQAAPQMPPPPQQPPRGPMPPQPPQQYQHPQQPPPQGQQHQHHQQQHQQPYGAAPARPGQPVVKPTSPLKLMALLGCLGVLGLAGIIALYLMFGDGAETAKVDPTTPAGPVEPPPAPEDGSAPAEDGGETRIAGQNDDGTSSEPAGLQPSGTVGGPTWTEPQPTIVETRVDPAPAAPPVAPTVQPPAAPRRDPQPTRPSDDGGALARLGEAIGSGDGGADAGGEEDGGEETDSEPAPRSRPTPPAAKTPWDVAAAGARAEMETGLRFQFKVTPPEAKVLFWSRGDRAIVQGSAGEFDPKKDEEARVLELPGDGEYLLVLRHSGLADYVVKVDAAGSRGSRPKLLQLNLAGGGAGAPSGGTVKVSKAVSFAGTPGDAYVFVDGRAEGRASDYPGGGKRGADELKLGRGRHVIRLEAPGFKPYEIRVEVGGGAAVEQINFRLEKE